MNKLFIIADDLTGALDTGVCFASAGINTCVKIPDEMHHQNTSDGYEVEVAIVESRHRIPEDAYQEVFRVVTKAVESGYHFIYKKTDSALRGNIGAELTATLDAANDKTLHFIPAFPKMNRISREGILYINQSTPVAESVFAKDPFNPVKHSAILEIIAEQTDNNAYMADITSEQYQDGIAVYDASNDQDILEIGRHLVKEVGAKLFAGCAGFASTLPKLIDFEKSEHQGLKPSGKIAVFCGSVNPISLEQCSVAEQNGHPRFHLQRNRKFLDSTLVTDQITTAARENSIVMLDTGAKDMDSSEDDVFEQSAVVAKAFSTVISGFLKSNPDVIPFIIGGDTLLALARNQGIGTFLPIKEITPGVVLSRYQLNGKWHFIITKSGGFGSKNLIAEIAALLACQGA